MAVGIDIGTGNIVAARQGENNKTIFAYERNAFVNIGKWQDVRKKLARTKISYTKLGEEVYIIGTAAYNYANVFGEIELHRPMALGMLNPKEKNSLPVLKELLASLLGEPQKENETCTYVVPSAPIDTGSHTVYHEDILETIIKSLGYRPIQLRESVALAYSSLVEEDLTGITCSCGAGMANIAVLFQGLTALDFSVTKSGDYIDENAAKETDRPVPHITHIKESEGFSLNSKDGSREQLALISYYRFVIKNILTQIANLFNTTKGMPQFKEPIKIICGGGTSMVNGFIELFEAEFKALDFPINIKSFEIAKDPLFAVAQGALSEAIIEEE